MKTTISQVKNIQDGINSRLDIVKEKISELEDIAIEITQNKTQKEELNNREEFH